MKPALLSLTPEELGRVLGGPGRAQDVFAALRRHEDPFAPGVLAPKAQLRLTERTRSTELRVVRQSDAADGTRKLLCELGDGRRSCGGGGHRGQLRRLPLWSLSEVVLR